LRKKRKKEMRSMLKEKLKERKMRENKIRVDV
jgi:hypothetical protein